MAHRLSLLPAQDSFRHRMEAQLLNKMYDMGVLNLGTKLSDIETKITVSSFCRQVDLYDHKRYNYTPPTDGDLP